MGFVSTPRYQFQKCYFCEAAEGTKISNLLKLTNSPAKRWRRAGR